MPQHRPGVGWRVFGQEILVDLLLAETLHREEKEVIYTYDMKVSYRDSIYSILYCIHTVYCILYCTLKHILTFFNQRLLGNVNVINMHFTGRPCVNYYMHC